MTELLTAFTFIFLAALPGRTTFALIMLAANGKARDIFFGAAAAFLIQSFISVMLGQALILISQAYIDLIAGILFFYFSRQFWNESQKHFDAEGLTKVESAKAVFTMIFTAELGDVSQLAIATASSRASSKVMVFFVAVGALWLITLLAIVVGRKLGRLVKSALLQMSASFLFFGIGAYLLAKGIGAMFFH